MFDVIDKTMTSSSEARAKEQARGRGGGHKVKTAVPSTIVLHPSPL